MKNLRFWLIGFIIVVAIFYNIERLDFGEENIIDISSFVYVLGLGAIILTFTLSPMRPVNIFVGILVWVFIYFVAKLGLYVFFEGRPLFGGIYTYLSITEVALFSMLIFFAYKLAFALQQFEDAVEKITFSNDSTRRVKQLEDADEEIQIEMFRSRHTHRSLGVVVVEPNAKSVEVAMHRMVQEVQQEMMQNYVVNNMAQMLSKYLRRTDIILEERNQGRFIVFCPDTNIEDLNLLSEYIQAIAEEQLGTAVTCGTSAFPDEAVTFEELVHKAKEQLHTTPGNKKRTISSEIIALAKNKFQDA